METRELHLELLLGKPVVDPNGNHVGHIEEMRAEQRGDEWVIVEYLVGIAAIAERLSAWTIGASLLRLLGAHKFRTGYRVPWNKLDLSEPDHPRLMCTVAELKEIPNTK